MTGMRIFLNIAKIFTDLWILIIDNCGREKFQGVLFRNNLAALCVVSMSQIVKLVRKHPMVRVQILSCEKIVERWFEQASISPWHLVHHGWLEAYA
jgi:hypothetical protein